MPLILLKKKHRITAALAKLKVQDDLKDVEYSLFP